MKISTATSICGNTLEKALSVIKEYGISEVEAAAGGYAGKEHCDPAKLLTDKTAFYKFCETFNAYDAEVSALYVPCNPVHPDSETAKGADSDLRNAILLAEKLEIDTVITRSGCPGDQPGAKYPNWVCGFGDGCGALLEWQWNEMLVPYWTELASFAAEHGVTKLAFEMMPGNCVYNPETLLRLRSAVGNSVCADLDPSLLILQGIDPAAAIRVLGETIVHVKAADLVTDGYEAAVNGILGSNTRSFGTVGYGQTAEAWTKLVYALRTVGYDGVLSVRGEDKFIPAERSLEKAVRFLSQII